MLHFSAPHQRKSPFNSTAERHSIRTTIPAALISDVFQFQKNEKLTPFPKKKLDAEIVLPFYSVAENGQSSEGGKSSSSSQTRKPGEKSGRERGGTVPEKLSNLAVKSNDVVFVSHRDSWYVYSSGSL